jgi:hypothetical protein
MKKPDFVGLFLLLKKAQGFQMVVQLTLKNQSF